MRLIALADLAVAISKAGTYRLPSSHTSPHSDAAFPSPCL
jgi:hypothetical protein